MDTSKAYLPSGLLTFEIRCNIKKLFKIYTTYPSLPPLGLDGNSLVNSLPAPSSGPINFWEPKLHQSLSLYKVSVGYKFQLHISSQLAAIAR